ncbi:MAG: PAS domain-containing protein, partial [Dehalococcoidia bacterium]|nr:PAS domain-containing protein [Dehalococcoidia bacterium]
MARKEQNKDQKKVSSKAEKQPAPAKKRGPAKAVKAAKAKSTPVEITASMQHAMETLSDMQLGGCIFDKEDRIISLNRRFSEVTGLQPEKIIGKKLAKNALWGTGEEQKQFAELFAEARNSGKTIAGERWPAGTGEEGNRYWNITLLPQQEDSKEYSGMYLTIEETCDSVPETGMAELIGGILKEGVQHNEPQSLLDSLVGILRDFCRCSHVKIALADKSEEHLIKAETGQELGLWDAGETLAADVINRLFEWSGEEPPPYQNSRRTIYLANINLIEDSLEGSLKDLVVNLRNSYGFRSIAFIPVKDGSRIKGFIQLANTKAGGIPAAILQAVEIAADQLHVMLERIELKEDLRRQRESLLRQMHERSAHLEAMSGRLKQEVFERKKSQDEMREQRDLAVTLNGIVNLDEALQLCLETAIRVADADSGGIYLVDRQMGGLVLSCSKGLSDEFIATVSQYEQSSPNYELVMKMNPVYATM